MVKWVLAKLLLLDILINGFKKKINKITEVTSPTFNIINEYQINQTKINHYDLI